MTGHNRPTASKVKGPKSGVEDAQHRSPAPEVLTETQKNWTPAGKAKASTPKTSVDAPSKTSEAVTDSFVHDDVECRIFRALADKAFIAKVFADSKGIIQYANPYCAAMLGYRPEEMVGQSLSIAHSPEQLKNSQRIIESSIEKGHSEPQENWYVRRDGTEFPLLVSCVSIKSPVNGETLTAMSGVDLSPIVQARKEYQTLFDEMLDAFSHFEVIFDDTGKAVDYRYLSVNPAWEKARNRRAKDVIGKTLREVSPDYDPSWLEMAGKVATTCDPIRTTIHYDGPDKYFEATVFCPTRGECAVILQDITARIKAEENAERLSAQLARAQRLESVGRLAGSVAHDFNNMLTVILGHVERNLERIERDDPVYADLVEISQITDRSAALTRQLLAFARNQPASPRIIDLNETVEAILVMLTRLVDEGITLNWNPARDLSPVRIDPTQVDQILANLIINARDSIVDVGDITIETKNVSFDEEFCAWHPDCHEGDYVELAVTDSGSGMDAETQAHLFEPFFTTKDQGQGTGLGLSTVYGVVQQNDGFITVTSEPGVGTTFRINLPQQAVESEPSSKPAVVKENDSGTETILLVEDEHAILKLTSTMLEGRGYAVLTADTPNKAIRLAEDHSGSIDLLLTDVIMPEMNGSVLAEQLTSSRPNLKCLFMSGYTANVIATHGVPDDIPFISKPFHLKDLAVKVREVLDS